MTDRHGDLPNWHLKLRTPLDVHRVATLLVRTLVEVHDAESPTDLELVVSETIDPFDK